jgi:ribosomal protein S18 acetylase RimI-like enzyme
LGDVRILVAGPEQAADLSAFLDTHRGACMVMRSNLRRVGVLDHGEVFQGAYVIALEAERIVGAAVLYWHGLLMLQAPQAAPELARAALEAGKSPLTGIMGAPPEVAAAIAGLGMRDEDFPEDTTEELFGLEIGRMVLPVGDRSGFVSRPMRAEDRDLVMGWSVAFRVAMWHETETPEMRERVIQLVDGLAAEGSVWVLEQAGRPLCCALFTARTPDAVQLGGVWTPDESRGRGYARFLVADMLEAVQAEGADSAYLFTEYENQAAQRLYRTLGFQTIGEYRAAMRR